MRVKAKKNQKNKEKDYQKILIFPEELIYKFLNYRKKILREVFKIITRNDLLIILITANEQSLNSRLSVSNLEYKTAQIIRVSEGKKLTKSALRGVGIKKSDFPNITLISNIESDAVVARKLTFPFIFVGKSKSSLRNVVTDFRLLPILLGLR